MSLGFQWPCTVLSCLLESCYCMRTNSVYSTGGRETMWNRDQSSQDLGLAGPPSPQWTCQLATDACASQDHSVESGINCNQQNHELNKWPFN